MPDYKWIRLHHYIVNAGFALIKESSSQLRIGMNYGGVTETIANISIIDDRIAIRVMISDTEWYYVTTSVSEIIAILETLL